MTTGPIDHSKHGYDDAFGLNDPRYVGTVLTKRARPRAPQADVGIAAQTERPQPEPTFEPDPFDLIPIINPEPEAPRAAPRVPASNLPPAPRRAPVQAPEQTPEQAPAMRPAPQPLPPEATPQRAATIPEPRPAQNLHLTPPRGATLSRQAPVPEVSEPMTVVWQGTEYAAAAWDVNGFRLATPLPQSAAQAGARVFDVTLLLGGGVTRIQMKVQVRAHDANTDQPSAFVFVDLDRAQGEVLHRVVGSVMSRQALSLTSLLNETEQNLTARAQTNETSRRFRSALQLGMAALVVAVAGYLSWSKMTTVNARFAAVTVASTALPLPAAGMISALSVQPGQRVTTGQVLGYVRPADHDDRLLSLADRRRQLEAERVELFARQGALASMTALGTQGLDGERATHLRAVELAEQRLGIERAILSSLQSGGLPTAERLRDRDQQRSAVLRAESDLLRAQAALTEWEQDQQLTAMGQTGSALRVDGTPEMMSLHLTQINDELAQIETRLQNAHLGMPIVSPCDCTVQDLTRQQGEWARPEDTFGTLTAGGAATVHALILAEDARSISVGDPARATLADGTTIVGRVAQLNYNPIWTGYAGLRADVFGMDRYARVEIAPDQPLSAPVGMVAQVAIDTSALLAQARALVGF